MTTDHDEPLKHDRRVTVRRDRHRVRLLLYVRDFDAEILYEDLRKPI